MSLVTTNIEVVAGAGAFALESHAGQLRKYTGAPYITHPQEVLAIVASVEHTPKGLAVSVLHDVVEMNPQVSLIEISRRFGREVAEGVDLLSEPRYGFRNRAARKEHQRGRLAAAPGWIQTIKLADCISNGKGIATLDQEFAKTYIKELYALAQALVAGDELLRVYACQLLQDEARVAGILLHQTVCELRTAPSPRVQVAAGPCR